MIKQVKKSKKGITPFFKVLILNIILLPSIVLADNIYMTCDQDNVTKNNLSCSIKGNTTKEIIAISLKVQTGNNLSFSKFIPSTVWQGDGEEGNVDLYTANDILGKYDIGTLNINVESSYQGLDTNITLYSISVYDKEGKEIKLDNYTKKIRITSSDNTLSNISISSGILSPTFSSNITTYSASVNTERIKISATPNNNKAKIEGDIGTKKLNYGNNTFKINVLSESKQTKTYILNITRIDNRNNQSNTTNNNNNTTKKPNNNTTNNNTNKEVKSSNTYLKSLTIKDNNITFQKNITNYDINVPYNTESIDIEALPEDNKSTVEITGNKDLKVGLNKIIILVTSEDKSTREYTINVNKKEEGYKLSNNNNISSIEITNYKLNYNKNKQNYILKIKNEKQLNIKVLLEDNKATYKILNNNNLKNNSIIKIIVSSEDNNTKTYTITVKTNHKTTIIIFITIITILIGLNIYRIIRRSKEHER